MSYYFIDVKLFSNKKNGEKMTNKNGNGNSPNPSICQLMLV